MPAKVILEVTAGPIQGRVFAFDSHDAFLFGRQADCHARLSKDDLVSRHHFLLEVNPPDACLRDLGSRNGTYVNGTKHGGRAANETPEEGASRQYPEVDLQDGDQIEVGRTAIRVKVQVPLLCCECGAEVHDGGPDQTIPCEANPRCSACQTRSQAQPQPQAVPQGLRCLRCGKDASGEMHRGRRGEYLCRACQTDVLSGSGGLRGLLAAAQAQVCERTPDIAGYEIGAELGKGGMGAVYQAVRKADGQTVAVKVMLAKIAVVDRMRQMFLREIEVTKQLDHPHLVKLLDSGSLGTAFFFVLDYCNGGSLDAWAKRNGGRLSLQVAGPAMLQCLDGLECAHRAGLVHRDLKPPNILLHQNQRRWRAKVTDFGLAKSFERAGLSGMTATGSFCGTFHYMPREQLTNFKFIQPVSDLWSLAATFYKLLTGHLPLNFTPDRDPMEVVLRDDPVPLGQRDASIPKAVAKVIDRSLATDPAQRHSSAAEMKDALRQALKRSAS
jgi:serine/threonine-protein kinase